MPIKKLDWDSDFFGVNIAQLDLDEGEEVNLNLIDVFSKKNDIGLIQACLDIANIDAIRLLEGIGFRLADLRVELSASLIGFAYPQAEFLIADKGDLAKLKEIAALAFVKSRYFREAVSRPKAASFFQLWVEKAVLGEFDDVCLKVEVDNMPAGFLTVRLIGEIARIGLLGIGANFQRTGLGTRLINSLFAYLKDKGIKEIKVATQGINIASQNFYIKNGFRVDSLKGWFYK